MGQLAVSVCACTNDTLVDKFRFYHAPLTCMGASVYVNYRETAEMNERNNIALRQQKVDSINVAWS